MHIRDTTLKAGGSLVGTSISCEEEYQVTAQVLQKIAGTKSAGGDLPLAYNCLNG